jgi:hypothetical protein
MTEEARAVIDRNTEYLFPSPCDPEKPVSKDLARDWLLRAERLAKVRKLDGSLWHAYRRGWVTARKHMSDTDVAAVGGWTGTDTLKECYQLPDIDTMIDVLEDNKSISEDVGR